MTYDIMFDYDDVIQPSSVRLHSKAYEMGLHNDPDGALHRWNGALQYGVTDEVWYSVFNEVYKEGFYTNHPPSPGVGEAMRLLKARGHRIHILTARGLMANAEGIQKATFEHLEKFELPYDTVTFASNKVDGMITALGGWAAPDAMPVFHYAIDDGPHNYEALDKVSIPVYLLEVPHNKQWRKEHPTARIVSSVDEYVDLILQEGP